MTNICDNSFYIYDEDADKISKIKNELTELFKEELIGDIIYSYEETIEGYCDSKWTYPESIFTPLIDKYKPKYFRYISSELGCGYYACYIYTDNKWKKLQHLRLIYAYDKTD